MKNKSHHTMRRGLSWVLWLAMTLAGASAFSYALLAPSPAKRVFLPGRTSSGHFQIEVACGACHSEAFADAETIQRACERCHAGELADANDSHPRDKFTDPRNAERVEQLDARYCGTCHLEHRPEITAKTGLTVPEDYCFRCHQDISEDRPSHNGMAFDSCDDSGCHNYHDNRALYEKFVSKHLDDPDHREDPNIAHLLARTVPPQVALRADQADADATLPGPQLRAWADSAHARGGVNCSGCHDTPQQGWTDTVSHERCANCHAQQSKTWLESRHGMRVAQGLPPLRVEDSSLTLQTDAAHRRLTCNSCHPAHGYDTREAAVDSCLGCHADEHSTAYTRSPHYALFQAEEAGRAPAGSGVSCSTCHMPRTRAKGSDVVFANHNQNDNLRPNDKMVRSVCLDCHGLSFSLDALADPGLIKTNFRGTPNVHVKTVELVSRRISRRDN